MKLNMESSKPIYVQVAEWLEAEILRETLKEEERIYSQYQLADMFNINPATAAKGLNILADENIVYKKRGLGMYVTANARQCILAKHKTHVLSRLIKELILEAKRLNVDEQELVRMLQEEKRKIEEEQP